MKKILFSLLLILAWMGVWEVKAQFNLIPPCNQVGNSIVYQTFDGVLPATPPFTNNTTIPGWYVGNAANYVGANNGSSGVGGYYSYGAAALSRSFGSLTSSSFSVARIGLRLKNSMGGTIYGFRLVYTGRQWRVGENGGNTDSLAVTYLMTGVTPATNPNDPATWTQIVPITIGDDINFRAPISNPTCGSNGVALDGTLPANSRTLPPANSEFFMTSPLADGEEMMIRWEDRNISCADHGMAIDDVILIPIFDPPQPDPIIGSISTCNNGVQTYEAPFYSNLVSYTWTINPSGPILTPSGRFVDIDFNGVTAGNYTLTCSPTANPPVVGCAGVSNSRLLGITVSDGAPPATISSATSEEVCPFQDYEVTGDMPIAPFTGSWAVMNSPPGWLGTLTNIDDIPGSTVIGQITALIPGTYDLRYSVGGGSCAATFVDMVLTVLPASIAPDAGVDEQLCDATSITLSGNTPDPMPATATWAFIDGPMTPTLNQTGIDVDVTGMDFPGIYRFEYIIDYFPCAERRDTVEVQVTPLIPADANVETELCDVTVTLLDGVSPAPGEGVWSIISQPGGASVINNLFTGQGQLIGMVPGTYIVEYTIINAPCALQVQQFTIENGSPLPLADAGLDQILCNVPSTTVNGNVLPVNVTGLWTFVSGPVTASITTSVSQGIITGMTQPGDYVFQWQLSSGQCIPETDEVTVTVVGLPTVADAGADISDCYSPTNSITITGNTPISGTGAWSIVSGANPGATIATILPSLGVLSNATPGAYTLRWTISNAPCTSTQDDMIVTVVAPPTTANAGVDVELCNQSTVTLTGNIPSVGSGSWSLGTGPGNPILNPIGNVLNVSNMNIPGTYTFVYTISNNPCPPSADNVIVTISAPTVGGSMTGTSAVCGNSAIATLNLSGNVGNIIRWERSNDNFATITTIANTTNIYTITGLNTTTYFRAVVKNGSCPTLNSSIHAVKVLPAPQPGTLAVLSGNFEGCGGANFGSLQVTGYVGSIIRWESSQDNFVTVTTINNTNPTYNFNNLPGATSFRVVVGNNVCPNVVTNLITINVLNGPVIPVTDPVVVVGCNNRATMTATATGGRPPYSYWINPANGNVGNYGNNGVIISNLVSGTYTLYVRDANFCYTSKIFTVGTIPSAPTLNTVSNITRNSARPYWNSIPPGFNIFYGLRYSTNPSGPWTTINNINALNYNIRNLLAGTTYYFQINARCTNGPISAWSSTYSFTTLLTKEDVTAVENVIDKLNIYPNPTKGAFNVQFDAAGSNQVKFEIIDITGKLVYQQEYLTIEGTNEIAFDLSDLTKGMYLLRIKDGDSYRSVKLVIE